jgi:hypothetical protein
MAMFDPKDDFDKTVDSLDELAERTRLFAFLQLAKEHGEVKDEKQIAEFVKKGASRKARLEMSEFMHTERSKKMVLDYYKMDKDEGPYRINVSIVNGMIDKMAEEIWAVRNIRLAAEKDDVEMYWDDEKQDFIFEKKGVKNV